MTLVVNRLRRNAAPLALGLVVVAGWSAQVLAQGAATTASGEAELVEPRTIAVSATPIDSFDRLGVNGHDYGALRFRGGLVLSSATPAFGGFSDLIVEPGGKRLLAISDDGAWLMGEIAYRGRAPVGLVNARMGPLKARSGRDLKGKREKDAEGLALVSGNLDKGQILIAFERVHRVGRFAVGPDGVTGPAGYLPLPPEVQRLRRNKSLEAVAVIDAGPLKGAVLTFAEQDRQPGDRPGYMLHAGKVTRLAVRDDGDMDVTGAAGLPDGGILLLERRFRWSEGVTMRLRRIGADELLEGRPLVGETLLRADMSKDIDNMEGVAVHRDARGALVVSLISDDNFNRLLQRTILLQFELRPAPDPGATKKLPDPGATKRQPDSGATKRQPESGGIPPLPPANPSRP